MSLRSFERRIKFFLYVGYAIQSLKLKLLTGDEVCMEMGRHSDKRLEKWVLASSSMAMVSSAIHCGFILLDSICEYNEEIDIARTCLISILQEHDGEKTAIGLRELFALAASRAVVNGFEDINEYKMSICDYHVCAFAAAYYSDFTRHSVIQPVPQATIPAAEARLIVKGKVEDLTRYKRHIPHLRKNINPTEAQLKKHPGLVYIIQFGNGKKTMIFGPKETLEEKRQKKKAKEEHIEQEEFIQKTQEDIENGTQKTLSAFFQPKKLI